MVQISGENFKTFWSIRLEGRVIKIHPSSYYSYYKLRRYYYKMLELLQNITFITNCDSTLHKKWKFSLTEEILNGRFYVLCSEIFVRPLTMFEKKLFKTLFVSWSCHYLHCLKCVQIRSYFWSVFSCIRTKYDIYSVNLRIQFECRKIRTRNNTVFGQFSRSAIRAVFWVRFYCFTKWFLVCNIIYI